MKRRNDGIDVEGKSPGFWFYPQDYERDMQILSLESQGLWSRMLCWMHFNVNNRGFLELATGEPMNEHDIAAKVGKALAQVTTCLSEMKRHGVYSVDERGCIWNRRMVKDTKISRIRADAARVRLQDAERTPTGNFAPAKTPAKSEQNTVPSVPDPDPVPVSDSSLSKTPPTPSKTNGVGGKAHELPKRPLPGEVKTEHGNPPGNDELWHRWRSRAERVLTQEVWSEEDWKQAYDEGWRRLGNPDRLAAVDRTDTSVLTDSAKKSAPVNFLRRRLFYRAVSNSPPVETKRNGKKQLTREEMERIDKEFGNGQ